MNAKASDGKPLAELSPGEVDRALRDCRDRNLPEEELLMICSHASPESKHKTKNKEKNQKQASIQTSLELSPSPVKSKPRPPCPPNLSTL